MTHHIAITASMDTFKLQAKATFGNQFIILSGDNGSGKTTLLRCLSGLETRAQGQWLLHQQIQMNTKEKLLLPTSKRRIGCVWTTPALLPWLNVLQNIQLGLNHLNAMDDILNELHIQHLLNHRPAMLSTGEAQRVSLARAIAMQPQMLLLDEPFSAQAPNIRQKLRVWLKEKQRTMAIPILMVSHDHDDTQALADQHWLMQQGQLYTDDYKTKK